MIPHSWLAITLTLCISMLKDVKGLKETCHLYHHRKNIILSINLGIPMLKYLGYDSWMMFPLQRCSYPLPCLIPEVPVCKIIQLLLFQYPNWMCIPLSKWLVLMRDPVRCGMGLVTKELLSTCHSWAAHPSMHLYVISIYISCLCGGPRKGSWKGNPTHLDLEEWLIQKTHPNLCWTEMNRVSN